MPTRINHKEVNFLSTIILVIVVIISLWNIVYVGTRVDRTERENLLLRAQNISLLLNEDDVEKLTGTSEDLTNPSYIRIKNTLTNVRGINTDTRFVYLMGLSDGKQFFYVDSEDPLSEDYSPPGQIYTEATETDIENHKKGITYTSGPYTDQWGTWISAYSPIRDNQTGSVVALLGMDVDASYIASQIWKARLITFFISLAVFLALLFLERLIKKSQAYGTELEKENKGLHSRHDHLVELHHATGIGEITWSKASDIVMFDQTIMDILLISRSKMEREEFLEFLNPDDVVRIQNEINLKTDATTPLTLRYHMRDANKKEHPITSICRLKRDSKGDLLSISCTAQDMSHITA